MKYKIVHDIPGRLRLKLTGAVPDTEAVRLREVLSAQSGVTKCVVYKKTGSVAVFYEVVSPAEVGTSIEAGASIDEATLHEIDNR